MLIVNSNDEDKEEEDEMLTEFTPSHLDNEIDS